MNKKSNEFNIKFNPSFVLRITPNELEKIKDFITSLENVNVVHSQVSGNCLYIKEEQ